MLGSKQTICGPSARPAQVRVHAFRSASVQSKRHVVVVRAADDDADLDARLAKLRQAKGATPYGEGAKQTRRDKPAASSSSSSSSSEPEAKKVYDFSGEQLHWEGPPSRGDLAFNALLSTTLVFLPISVGAIGRALFVKYRFTDKRFSTMTNAPWKQEQTDVAYQEVQDVVTVTRMFGAWGDMVVTLKNNDKVEMRSLEKYKELKEYILQRRDALGGGPRGPSKPSGIMDLDADDATAMAGVKKPKGFA